ncbi:MAG TPA: septation protein A [Methyloceanibacter sp.]|jgi:intracellular septation protein|nr:septation protein A [Methyloceanibacter sp.]
MTQPPKSTTETGPKTTIKKAKDSEQSVAGKLLIELGPLLVFFGVNAAYGIFVGTAAFMVATLLALGAAWWLYRKVPAMPIVSAGLVLAFGGLTLYLQDDTFIKIKPTIVYTMFAVLLIGGLFAGKHVLALLFGPVFNLTDEGWRKLTIRWAIFFVAMAILNEFVWRSFSTDTWVSFKAFGFLPITFVFAMSQVPLMQRYGVEENSQ